MVNRVKRNFLRVRTKNTTAAPLKKAIIVPNGKRAIFRLGSRTTVDQIFTPEQLRGKTLIEINTIAACQNSASKLLMKRCFNRFNVPTADWYKIKKVGNRFMVFDGIIDDQPNAQEFALADSDKIKYPVVAKHIYGAQGRGNYKLDNVEQLNDWLRNRVDELDKFIFEKFYTYSREYRLHVSENGCFYTCRKMLKRDCPEELKWQRHDDNCVWIVEENPEFNKPANWDQIVEGCVNALKSVGLTIGACDVKTQTNDDPKFIVLEINSAPSMGERTIVEYTRELTRIVNE